MQRVSRFFSNILPRVRLILMPPEMQVRTPGQLARQWIGRSLSASGGRPFPVREPVAHGFRKPPGIGTQPASAQMGRAEVLAPFILFQAGNREFQAWRQMEVPPLCEMSRMWP